MRSLAVRLAAAWGVLGVVAMLVQALVRLGPVAGAAIAMLSSPLEWCALVLWTAAMVWGEGWRGFHLRFSPRVVARALAIVRAPTPARMILAPLFCMSLFGASRRGLLVARMLLGGILVLIALVRLLDQPWRGVIDAGVVAGLGIGTLSIGYHAVRAMRGSPPSIDPDLGPSG